MPPASVPGIDITHTRPKRTGVPNAPNSRIQSSPQALPALDHEVVADHVVRGVRGEVDDGRLEIRDLRQPAARDLAEPCISELVQIRVGPGGFKEGVLTQRARGALARGTGVSTQRARRHACMYRAEFRCPTHQISGVSTMPGEMQFTLRPRPAHSQASDCVILTTAALEQL